MKGFAFGRRFASASSLLATLTRNNRELLAFLNTFTVRFEGDASTVALPGDLSVAGDSTVTGDLTVTGDIVTDDWTAASLLNSWVNFSASTHRTAAHLITSDGTVHVKGRVKSGVSITAAILKLPAGLRPSLTILLPAMTGAGTGVLQIVSNGNLSFLTDGSTTWSSIECSFQV